MGFIYKLTFSSNKSYIGQTNAKSVDKRVGGHAYAATRDSKCAVHRAWRKYGAPKIEVLGEFAAIELSKMEEYFIAAHGTFVGGYNMTPGGEKAPMTVPEIAKRAGASNKNQKRSPEFCAKMKAVSARPEIKLARSARMAGNKLALGQKQSDETKAKKSASLKGKNKGKKHSAEWRANHSSFMQGNQLAKGKNIGNKYAKDKHIGNKFAAGGKGMFWITNGIAEKKTREDVPAGWRRGRK